MNQDSKGAGLLESLFKRMWELWEIDLRIVILPLSIQRRTKEIVLKKYKAFFDERPKERQTWKCLAIYISPGYLGLGKGSIAEEIEQSLTHEWLHAILHRRINWKACSDLDKVLYLQRNNPFINKLLKEGFL